MARPVLHGVRGASARKQRFSIGLPASLRYLISVHREVVSAPVPESGSLTMSDMIKIQPIQRRVDADVSVPGSKSYTNRALLIAALANGRSRLAGALESDDTRVMADALSALGVRIRNESEGAVIVDGAGGRIPVPNARLFVGNSGTAARFLTGYVSLGCGEYTLDGDPRMRERPIQDLMDALRPLGVRARSLEGNGCPPIVVHGAGLEGGRTELPGNRSSQYLSALLMVAPYARQFPGTVEADLKIVHEPRQPLLVVLRRVLDRQALVIPHGKGRGQN